MRVDLNGDVGESFGVYRLGHDALLMTALTSASVACGFHGGDPGVMRETVALAKEHGVAIGAHPGLPDLVGFGRRQMQVSPREVEDLVVYQIGALAAIASAQGMRLRHVKAHGALYNMAAREFKLAEAVAQATASVDPSLVLFGLAGSQLVTAGQRAGLRTAREAFADRAYRGDGSLVPRGQRGALLENSDAVVDRVVSMVRDRAVSAIDGTRIDLEIDTVCVHGDTPGAPDLASRIRQALTVAGVSVLPLG